MPYRRSFIVKSWLNDLEDLGQRSLWTTHPLMLVILFLSYEANTECGTDRWIDGVKSILHHPHPHPTPTTILLLRWYNYNYTLLPEVGMYGRNM